MFTPTDEQRAAIESTAPVAVMVAGPGTGKTATLTRRVLRLIDDGARPSRILCCTFTNDAAGEMRDRLGEHLHPDAPQPEVTTIHSWAAGLLRAHGAEVGIDPGFVVYDDADVEALTRVAAQDLGHKPAKRVSTLLRREGVQEEVERRMMDYGAVTFDMIEAGARRLLAARGAGWQYWREAYDHVLVDEYQDTNLAQAFMMGSLAPRHLFAVGDPRQAIYGWRGASMESLRAIQASSGAEVLPLTNCWRFGPEVAELANTIAFDHPPITGAGGPSTVHHHATSSTSELARVVIDARARYAAHEIAVLARTWSVLEDVAHELDRAGQPAITFSKRNDPWEQPEARRLVRLLRLAIRPGDEGTATALFSNERWFSGAVARARRARSTVVAVAAQDRGWTWHGRPSSSSPVEILDQLVEHGLVVVSRDLRERVSRWRHTDQLLGWLVNRGANRRERYATGEAVPCLTVHAAKGLEWPCVIIADACAEVYSSGKDHGESRRVLYVAITRAERELHLCRPRLLKQRWGTTETTPIGAPR